MNTIRGSCTTCKHFEKRVEDGAEGLCRVRSPQVSVFVVFSQNKMTGKTESAPQVTSNFPQVGKDCWCGEWSPALIPMNG